MLARVRLLALSTRATIGLLLLGAFLVVLGFFDQFLNWDVFSPPVEKLLTAIFASSVALGAFGLAISVVAGIRDSVVALQRMVGQRDPGAAEESREMPRQTAFLWLGGLFALLAVTIWGLNLANDHVLRERQRTFKRMAVEHLTRLEPRWATEVSRLSAPCPDCVSADLAELVMTLRGSSICNSVEVFVRDPKEPAALWRYPTTDHQGTARLSRLFVVGDTERAIAQALAGDTAWIDQINGDGNWVWYQPIRGAGKKILAVLRIEADPNQSFREED